MTKFNAMLMSLPAALPAAYLVYLLVMVFLGFGGGDTVIHQALAGASLGVAAIVAFLPAGILLFYQGPEAPKKKPNIPVAATSLVESLTPQREEEFGGDDVEAMDEVIASSQEMEVSQEGFDLGGFGESEEEIAEAASPLANDDAFDGIVDEITETDDELVLSQDAMAVSDDSLDLDDEIADFDDLFDDDKKA